MSEKRTIRVTGSSVQRVAPDTIEITSRMRQPISIHSSHLTVKLSDQITFNLLLPHKESPLRRA